MSRSCRGSARFPSAGTSSRRSCGSSATRPCCSCSGCKLVRDCRNSCRELGAHPPLEGEVGTRDTDGDQIKRGVRSTHQNQSRRKPMTNRIRKFLLAGVAAMAACPAIAADVTPDRLANADKEPQNWLMNHRTYDAQRYSPLDKINKATIKDLKLAYAVAIGGTSPNENLQATPLAEDGFLYVVDQWGVLYKIDARSGDLGRIVWRMDPGQEKVPLANRGAALWGNFVITVANYPARAIATNKETGKVAWEANLADGQADLQLTAAPLAVKDKIIIGAAGGDRGVRDLIDELEGANGKELGR